MQSTNSQFNLNAPKPETFLAPGTTLARPSSVTIGTIEAKPRATLFNTKNFKPGFTFDNFKGGNWPKRNLKDPNSGLMNPSTPKSVGQMTFDSPASFFRTYKESKGSQQTVTANGFYHPRELRSSREGQSDCILKLDMNQHHKLTKMQLKGDKDKIEVGSASRLRYPNTHEINIVESRKNDGSLSQPSLPQKNALRENTSRPLEHIPSIVDHRIGDSMSPSGQRKTSTISKPIMNSHYEARQSPNEPKTNGPRKNGIEDFLRHNIKPNKSDNGTRDSQWLQRESQEETRSKVDTKPDEYNKAPHDDNKQDILSTTVRQDSNKPRKQALNNFFNKIQGIQDKLTNLEKRFDTYGDNYKFPNERDRSLNADLSLRRQMSRRGTDELSQNNENCLIDIKKKTLNSSRHLKSKASLKQDGKDNETSFRVSDKYLFDKANESLIQNTRYQTAEKFTEKKQDKLLSNDPKAKLNPFAHEKGLMAHHQSNSLLPLTDKPTADGQFLRTREMPFFKTFTQSKNPEDEINLKIPFTDGKHRVIDFKAIEIDDGKLDPVKYYSEQLATELVAPEAKKTASTENKVISNILFENLIENYPDAFNDTAKNSTRSKGQPLEVEWLKFQKKELLSSGIADRRFDHEGTLAQHSNIKNESTLCEPTEKSKSVKIPNPYQNSPDLKAKSGLMEQDNFQESTRHVRLNFGVNLSSSKDSNTDKSPMSGLFNTSFEVAIGNLHIRFNNEKIRIQQFRQFIDRLKSNYHEKLEKATNFKNDILKTHKINPLLNGPVYDALQNTYEYLKKEVNLQHMMVMENMQIFQRKEMLAEHIGQALSMIGHVHNPNPLITSLVEMFESAEQLQPIHHLQNDDHSHRDTKFSCISNLEAYDQRIHHSDVPNPSRAMNYRKESSSSQLRNFSPVRHLSHIETKKGDSPKEPISQMVMQIQQKYNLKPTPTVFHKEPANSNFKAHLETSGVQSRQRQRSVRGVNQQSYLDADHSQVETTFFKNIRQQLDSLASNMKTGKNNRLK
jgi:hypothetical protein